MRLYARLELHLARSEHFYWNSKFIGNKKCYNSCVKNIIQRQIDRWILFLKLSNVIPLYSRKTTYSQSILRGRGRGAMWFQKKILQENIPGGYSFTDREAGKNLTEIYRSLRHYIETSVLAGNICVRCNWKYTWSPGLNQNLPLI